MKDLTQRQAQVLELIIGYVNTYGYPPTLREIGDRMDIGSTNGVKDHLRALVRKGYVRLDEQTARGIQVLRYPEGIAATVVVLPSCDLERWRSRDAEEVDEQNGGG